MWNCPMRPWTNLVQHHYPRQSSTGPLCNEGLWWWSPCSHEMLNHYFHFYGVILCLNYGGFSWMYLAHLPKKMRRSVSIWADLWTAKKTTQLHQSVSKNTQLMLPQLELKVSKSP
jgi:hypothetical protein